MTPNPTITADPDGDIIITVFRGHPTMETEIHIPQSADAALITEADISFNTESGELIITTGDQVERHDLSFVLQAS